MSETQTQPNPDAKQFIENTNKGLKELRDTVDRLAKVADGLDEAKVARLNDYLDGENDRVAAAKADKERADAVEQKLIDLETAIKTRADAGGEPEDTPEVAAQKAGFRTYLRKHTEAMEPAEVKTLTVGTNATAGYLAPADFANRIVALNNEVSPIRSVADVLPIGASDIEIPVETSDFDASWRAEGAARPVSTDPNFALVKVPPHEITANIRVTHELLEDSVFDIEAYLQRKFAEKFAKGEGTAFISGSGTNRPLGVNNTTAANGPVIAKIAPASGFLPTVEKLLELVHLVPTAYARNGTFAFNRNTLGRIRGLKDSDGQFIFQPGMSGITGAPATILGHPYIECPDMDSFGTTGKRPVVFGDWRQGYLITDRLGINVLRDPFTQATNGAINFVARKRVGGRVLVADAFRVYATN